MKGTVYLLHFDRPYHHAQHYIGWTQNIEVRIEAHMNGKGSRLVNAVAKAGIPISVVRTWQEKDKNFEKKLKKLKQARIHCPICEETVREKHRIYSRERKRRINGQDTDRNVVG